VKYILFKSVLAASILVNGTFLYKYTGLFKTKPGVDVSESNSNFTGGNRTYYNALQFSVVGRGHDEPNFNRLPAKYKHTVRPEVWKLSTNSSGISVAFTTNSPFISIRWSVQTFATPSAMSRIGANGVDLYCFKEGRWQYVSSGVPSGKKNENLVISDMDSTMKDFMLYLPLYDVTESIEIGVSNTAKIIAGKRLHDQPSDRIIFYGTSITQGRGASRPGMNYPSIISRHLNAEVINLGFNSNGRFESSIGEMLCEIKSGLIVLDCTPNSVPDTIRNNLPKLIRQIRTCKPNIPILLIESIQREYSYFKTSDSTTFGSFAFIKCQNQALMRVYQKAVADSVTNLYYLESSSLLGNDHEATVDGTHLSDLGLQRIANAVEEKIEAILNPDSVITY